MYAWTTELLANWHPTPSFPAICTRPGNHPTIRPYLLLSPADGCATSSLPVMATSTASLAQLLAQTSIDNHDEVLQSTNAAIKKNKTDLEAQHARAAALLHLDRFDDAVKVFEDVKGLQEKARFEYAYALYKTGDAVKAVEIAQSAGTDISRGMKHVLAQAVRPWDFARRRGSG
jgi:tetratricopeptide (TPR) repeat protein